MKTDILGVNVDAVNMEEAKALVIGFLGGEWARSVYTPNPEMVMAARKDSTFRDILNRGDLVIPDGIGIVYASKLNKVKINERVSGFDLIQEMFREFSDGRVSFYFFGGAPLVAEEAKAAIENKHPKINIIGVADGYFDEKKEKLILEDIKVKRPDILIFCSSFPRQEKWIDSHLKELPVKVVMGAGGSFDVMSGRVKRAPAAFQRLGLEWFYRLVSQPSRIKRQIKLPLFVLAVIADRLRADR